MLIFLVLSIGSIGVPASGFGMFCSNYIDYHRFVSSLRCYSRDMVLFGGFVW